MTKNAILLSSMLLFAASCSSDSSNEPIPTELNLPGDYVFTTDESIIDQDPAEPIYTYIYTNGAVMYRDDIQQSYPLNELVQEELCLFTIAESKCAGTKKCYSIQLTDEPENFLAVGKSSNKEEIHLFLTEGEKIVPVGSPSYYTAEGDNSKFYFHKMPDVNGVRTYAIESVGMPGWYISDAQPGFNYAANVVTFESQVTTDLAPEWQLRGPH